MSLLYGGLQIYGLIKALLEIITSSLIIKYRPSSFLTIAIVSPNMVFANLQAQEKDAFFSLLDEYFATRPEIFANVGNSADSQPNISAQGAASAAHRAMAGNPELTAKLFSAGLKHGVPKSSPYSAAASDPEVNNAAGRVAAASLAFSASRNNTSSSNSPPPVAEKPSAVSSLKSKFGSDVDTSSAKNLFGSLRNSTANKNSSPPAPFIPPAFPHKQSSFEPPPSRRLPVSSVSSDPPPAPPPPPPPPGRQYQEEEEEEEEQGEWAEALYDYDSTEPGDLSIKENQRMLITERTSDDWWTGEVNGKKGLFPASYVKLL